MAHAIGQIAHGPRSAAACSLVHGAGLVRSFASDIACVPLYLSRFGTRRIAEIFRLILARAAGIKRVVTQLDSVGAQSVRDERAEPGALLLGCRAHRLGRS